MNKKNINKKTIYIFILLGIFCFHIYMNYEILNKSKICRVYDQVNYLTKGMLFYNVMFSWPDKFENIKEYILTLSHQAHPPFVGIIEALMCKSLVIFNGKIDTELMILSTNAFFEFILLVSVFSIGSILYSNNVGLLSSFLVSFFPMIFGYSRNMMLEFPLASMVSLSILMLLKTNKFQSLLYSILLGITLGISQLTQESFVGFIVSPLIYYYYQSCRAVRDRKVILNAIFALLCAIIIAGIVYLRPANFLYAFNTYIAKAFIVYRGEAAPIFTYLSNAAALLGSYISIAIIPLLTSYIIRLRSQNKIILLWVVIPFIFYSLIYPKAFRYIIPILPAFSLLIAQELFNSKLFLKAKKAYVGLLIFLASFQYGIYFFDTRFLDPYFFPKYSSGYNNPPGILTYRKDAYYSTVLKLLEFLKKEDISDKTKRMLFVFIIGDIHNYLAYRVELEKLPFLVDCPLELDWIDAPQSGTVNWHDYVLDADYVVDIDMSNYVTGGGKIKDIEIQLREGFEKHRDNFKKVKDIEIINGSHLYIYSRGSK